MNTNLPKNTHDDIRDSRQLSQAKPVNAQAATLSSGGKEKEFAQNVTKELIRESPAEIELPKEVESAGVQKISEKIELPPDVKKIGMTSATPPPLPVQTQVPTVILPISDQQVISGSHQNVTNAIRWLSLWCIRKLQKAHVILKVVHGKIIRIKE
jgi:hypothetical protein